MAAATCLEAHGVDAAVDLGDAEDGADLGRSRPDMGER
jgi:hypothetical protein